MATATMFIARNATFNLSKAFPGTLSLRPSPKVSRVCFASSSKYSEGQNAFEGSRDERRDAVRNLDEMTNRAKEAMGETKEKTEEVAGSMGEKAREGTNKVAEAAENTKEGAEEYAHEANEKVKEGTNKAAETAGSVKERAEEVTAKASENFKEGSSKAAETVQGIGEKAKETVEIAWDTAKETGQKIKENVVGTLDDEDDEGVKEIRKRAGKPDN